MSYWKADRHQWGPGHVHVIHTDGTKTLCGRKLADVPGHYVDEIEYDCRACAQMFASEERRRKNEEQWRQRQLEYEKQQAARNREWWTRYQTYLRSPEWAAKREAVFERAQGRCEARYPGCGGWATQVHHTTYAHVENEPLFELHAICDACHERLTEDDRRRRGALR